MHSKRNIYNDERCLLSEKLTWRRVRRMASRAEGKIFDLPNSVKHDQHKNFHNSSFLDRAAEGQR